MLFFLLFNWMLYFLCLCIIVDYLKIVFEEYKEKIDMYVELNNVMKYGINEFGEKNIIIVIGDVGIGKISFVFELMFWM